MATITVTLVGPEKKDKLRDLPGIGHALRAGVHALWLTIRGIAVGVAYAGPITLSVLALALRFVAAHPEAASLVRGACPRVPSCPTRARVLGRLRFGPGDPTTAISDGQWWWSAHTAGGPATIAIPLTEDGSPSRGGPAPNICSLAPTR